MKGIPSVRSRLPFVYCNALTLLERMAVSAVQTQEQAIEKYITKITAVRAEVDECTRLVAAECALNYFIAMPAVTIND